MAHSTASPQAEAAQPPWAPTFLHLWEGTASSGSATLCISYRFCSHRRPSVLLRIRRHHPVLQEGRARTLEVQGAGRALGVPLAQGLHLGRGNHPPQPWSCPGQRAACAWSPLSSRAGRRADVYTQAQEVACLL